MISSISNSKVKYVRRLQSDRRFRSDQQQFVIEGTRWLTELLSSPHLVLNVFCTETWLLQDSHTNLFAQVGGNKHLTSDAVMAAMSTTESPPGVLATVTIDPAPIPQEPTLILILDGIMNPGNLGTMLRTAAAAGVDAVILTPGSVDQYNPKVVRGSMGALLRMPVHQLEWFEISKVVEGLKTRVAAASGSTAYNSVDWRHPSALIISNEARGASSDAYSLADESIAIPIDAESESLNAAIAAGIILFEAVRQRRLKEDFS